MEHTTTRIRQILAAMLLAVGMVYALSMAAPLQAHAAATQGDGGCTDENPLEITDDKPEIISIDYDRAAGSGPVQPTIGGKYIWVITFCDCADLSVLDDDFFTVQRKPWKQDWKNSKCPVAFFKQTSKTTGTLTVEAIPEDNLADNVFRFTYGGEVVNCPPIVQLGIVKRSDLQQALKDAQADREATPVSADGQDRPAGTEYVTPDVATAYQGVIDAAQSVYDAEASTQDDVDAAAATLKEALEAFDAAKMMALPIGPDQGKPETEQGDSGNVDPAKQMGADGTPLGIGASVQAAETAILSSASVEGPAGSVFAKLQLRSTKQAKNSVTLKWAKVPGAAKYAVYGAAAGKSGGMAKVAETAKTSLKVAKVAGKKLAKGKYYRFQVVALDKSENVVSASKVAHVATKGDTAANPSKVATKAKKNRIALKKGKSFKLGAKQMAKGKVKKFRKLSYESTDPGVATVTKKGVVKAKSKGACFVYAYAQNGVFVKVKVAVKTSGAAVATTTSGSAMLAAGAVA